MPRLQDPRELPIRQVYTALRDKWLAVEDGKHYGSRARRDNVTLTIFLREKTGLNLTEQVVSQWATGSGQRRVAPSALYALMAFKLSLTLLVRYRSFYSIFNFGRHIPAT